MSVSDFEDTLRGEEGRFDPKNVTQMRSAWERDSSVVARAAAETVPLRYWEKAVCGPLCMESRQNQSMHALLSGA